MTPLWSQAVHGEHNRLPCTPVPMLSIQFPVYPMCHFVRNSIVDHFPQLVPEIKLVESKNGLTMVTLSSKSSAVTDIQSHARATKLSP